MKKISFKLATVILVIIAGLLLMASSALLLVNSPHLIALIIPFSLGVLSFSVGLHSLLTEKLEVWDK